MYLDNLWASNLLIFRTINFSYFIVIIFLLLINVSHSQTNNGLKSVARFESGGKIHALVNSISLGRPPKFDGPKGEFPISNTATVKTKVSTLQIIISGILISSADSFHYGDLLHTWHGSKFDKQMLPNKNRNKMNPIKAVLSIVNQTSDRVIDTISMEVANQHDRYSFKQNRILKRIVVGEIGKVDTITFILPEWMKQGMFRGFLRVQMFGPNNATNKKVVDDCPLQVRFEEYGLADTTICIGHRLELKAKTPVVFEGDFLLPVGITDIRNGTTNRMISGLPRNERVNARISGGFIFSGFQPTNPGKDIGGGGGWQDAGWRMDHLKEKVPKRYKASNPFHPTDLVIYNSRGKKINYDLKPKAVSPNHEYEITFKAPGDGKVYFHQRDGFNLKKTADNCGVFCISILGQ